jgi:hypothetical protein
MCKSGVLAVELWIRPPLPHIQKTTTLAAPPTKNPPHFFKKQTQQIKTTMAGPPTKKNYPGGQKKTVISAGTMQLSAHPGKENNWQHYAIECTPRQVQKPQLRLSGSDTHIIWQLPFFSM